MSHRRTVRVTGALLAAFMLFSAPHAQARKSSIGAAAAKGFGSSAAVKGSASVMESQPGEAARKATMKRMKKFAKGAAAVSLVDTDAMEDGIGDLTGELPEGADGEADGAEKAAITTNTSLQGGVLPPFTYNAAKYRDPFVSPLAEIKKIIEKQQQEKSTREKEYLEGFEMDSLKFVATILMESGESVAVIQDPNGRGHAVKVGNYLGTREGIIEEITGGSVTIMESHPTSRDPLASKALVLRLHEKSIQNEQDNMAGEGGGIEQALQGKKALPTGSAAAVPPLPVKHSAKSPNPKDQKP